MSKTDPSIYVTIAEIIGVQPNEILYVDDQAVNVEAANMAGVQTVLFSQNEELLNLLKNKELI